ncbi:hypothetical protein D9615_000330 [Tricholomella constricta]|uniref:Reverse transcriptase Ty1/copia-type domain-containing protein n=1 Tax=Tricholomella constricta TaxID=117010 RepID=A0A8H5HQS7_9AGAR|nr:hypothetical protein D9615_000330 [Tricholomella constricta]
MYTGSQSDTDDDLITITSPAADNFTEDEPPTVPAHDTITAPQVPRADTPDLPLALRRSPRLAKTTAAARASKGSEQNIEADRLAGREWATDGPPTGLSATAYPEHLDDKAASLVDPTEHWVPKSYTKAMTRPDLWRAPMDKEIENLRAHKVWTLVDRPPNVKPMKNRWTYANKYDVNGILIGRKARLVAKGFTQVPGVDYIANSYASVVRYESLRMNLALAAAKDMAIWQIDYIGAYLNAPSHVPIIMEQVEGYEEKVGPGEVPKVARVTKALYGTMDGAFNWQTSLSARAMRTGNPPSRQHTRMT